MRTIMMNDCFQGAAIEFFSRGLAGTCGGCNNRDEPGSRGEFHLVADGSPVQDGSATN